MRKIVLICAILLFDITGASAQEDSFFNKQLRKEIMEYLVSIRLISSDEYDDFLVIIETASPNDGNITKLDAYLPLITNELTGKSMIFHPDSYEYGIYSFNTWEVHSPKHILLKKGHEYKILEMNGYHFGDGKGASDFNEIMSELFQYFEDNPDVNPDLLPLYTYAVLNVYFENQIISLTPEHIEKEYERILRGEKTLFIE